MKSLKSCWSYLTTGLLAVTWACGAVAANDETTTNLPETVPFELGDAQFDSGDSITILKVSGTKDRIMIGGTYCVEGTYTLGTHEKADLGFFATGNDTTPTPIDPQQTAHITKGTGTFRLTKVMSTDGYLHVSFYAGNSFGGIYFGQGKWVLHHGNYSQFNGDTEHKHKEPSRAHDAGKSALPAANRAMLEYLGNPVAIPDDLAESYTAQGLQKAIKNAALQAGATIDKIEIEDSEFPALVGVICEHDDYEKLMGQIKTMSGYADQGSVGSHHCHAMNIIPYSTFPADSGDQIQHRLMLREQMFYDQLSRLK